MKNHYWLSSTVTRTTTVVPVHGSGMADACAKAAGFTSGTAMVKRHANAIQAAPSLGRQPWSPPVT
ncbi:MAG: hypothetical protein JWQ74_325 [Marmoricola sp.]|nr:hypothetical protein [Marmoricola sp.]